MGGASGMGRNGVSDGLGRACCTASEALGGTATLAGGVDCASAEDDTGSRIQVQVTPRKTLEIHRVWPRVVDTVIMNSCR